MENGKCISVIIYNDNGQHYFLIIHDKNSGWGFVRGLVAEGESEEDAVARKVMEETGIKQFRISKKLEGARDVESNGQKCDLYVYLVEANMNVPVHIRQECDNYLWTTKDSVAEKLGWEKEIFNDVLEVLK